MLLYTTEHKSVQLQPSSSSCLVRELPRRRFCGSQLVNFSCFVLIVHCESHFMRHARRWWRIVLSTSSSNSWRNLLVLSSVFTGIALACSRWVLLFFQCPQDIDKEIKDLKIALNTRLRAAAPWRILRMRLQSVRRISTGSFSIRLEATRLSPWIITEPHLVWIFRSFTWPWRLCPKIYSWHVLRLQLSLRQRRTCLNEVLGTWAKTWKWENVEVQLLRDM